jgi:predicted permease
MRFVRTLQLWTRFLFKRSQAEADLNDELRDYIEHQTKRHLAAGMPSEQARRAARQELGGIEQLKETCRDVRSTAWIENTIQDIAYACRTLRKNWGFALAAVSTMALGIGANTAIFDIINGVILRPLPYPDPGRLVEVEQVVRTGGGISFSYPDFLDCARDSRSFQSIAAWRNRGGNLTSPGEPEFVPTRQVSASFLTVLGIQPVLGRNFTEEDAYRSQSRVAIIDYSLWKQRFGFRPGAIGGSLVLNGEAYTVIGVLPAAFQFLDHRPVLTLISQSGDPQMQRRDLHPGIRVVGRMKQGAENAHVNAEVRVIGERLALAYPDADSNLTFRSVSLQEEIVGNTRHSLLLLGGAVGLVLLIACVNVANLFVTRSISREREFAIRAALGADRWRLIRQLLAESLLVSFVGGAVGLMIASVGARWAVARLPEWLPPNSDITVDARVWLFCFGASIASGLVLGIAPSFRRESGRQVTMTQRTRSRNGGVPRVQQAFVVAELALAFVLLAGATLMLRTIYHLWTTSPGFDSHHLLTMRVAVPPAQATDAARIRNAWRDALDRVGNTPGVKAAALDSVIPLSGDVQTAQYWTTPAPQPPKNASNAFFFTPSPEGLQTLEIPLVRGRFFNSQDRIGSEPVAIIDETLANTTFQGTDPLGKEISAQLVGRMRIVGVVANIKHRSLDEGAYHPPEPTIYVPFLQLPDTLMPLTTTGMHLLVRTSVDASAAINAVKTSVIGTARDTPVRDIATMDQLIGQTTAQRRGVAFLLAIFAAIALSLAAIGIYSVISYVTNRRVQEIGIRVALGAQPRQVVWLVVRQGVRAIAVGAVLGLIASTALTRTLTKLLYGVKPVDPASLVAVAVGLSSLAVLAVYGPARRAARIDPSAALRHE